MTTIILTSSTVSAAIILLAALIPEHHKSYAQVYEGYVKVTWPHGSRQWCFAIHAL